MSNAIMQVALERLCFMVTFIPESATRNGGRTRNRDCYAVKPFDMLQALPM
jgi:hypothetical protein